MLLLSCNNSIIYDRDTTKVYYVENDSSFVDEIILGYDGVTNRTRRTIAISYLYVNRHTAKDYWSVSIHNNIYKDERHTAEEYTSPMPSYYRASVYESKVDLDTYKAIVKYIQSMDMKEGMPKKTYNQWGASSVILKYGYKRYHKSMKRREYVSFLRGLLPLLNKDAGLLEAVSREIYEYQDEEYTVFKLEDAIYGELDEVEFNGNNKLALQLKSPLNIDYVLTDIAERMYNNKLHPCLSQRDVPLYLGLSFNRENIDSLAFEKFQLSSAKIHLKQEGLSMNLPTTIDIDEQLPECRFKKLINNNSDIYIQVFYGVVSSRKEEPTRFKRLLLSDAWFVYHYDKKTKQFVYQKYIKN